MNILKKVLYFYLNASIHVAFSVYAFVRITEIYFKLSTNENLNMFIFLGTIVGYNFVKYAGVAKLHYRSLTNSLKIILTFTFFCFLALCYYFFKIPIKTVYYTIPFIFLTILYAVPFLSGFHKTLRQVSYLKIVVVAIVWSGFTVLMPVVNATTEISIEIILLMLQRFLIVVVLILPFDLRDIKYDAISLHTIPRKIGVENTKRVGLILMVIALVLEYLISISNVMKAPFMIFFFLVVLFLMRAKTDQSKYYCSFGVESLPIVWWLFLLGFDNF